MTRNIYATNGRGAVAFNPYPLEALVRQRATAPLFYDCVWIDGELVPAEDAHVGDQAGIFEEIRCYPTDKGPAIFRLEAHLQRFLQAAQLLGAGELRYSLLELRRAVHVTVHVNSLSACTVRPIVYLERQAGGDPYPSVAVTVAIQHTAQERLQDEGLWLMALEVDQEGPDGALTHTGLQSRAGRAAAARTTARRNRFDEAILVGRDGMVIDCTGGNLFVVRDGAVYTSPAANDVAHETALTLLHDLGVTVHEEKISRHDLYRADELFLCGAAREIAPVGRVNERPLQPAAPGPITRGLQQLYSATTRGEGRRSRGWLEYVMMEPLF